MLGYVEKKKSYFGSEKKYVFAFWHNNKLHNLPFPLKPARVVDIIDSTMVAMAMVTVVHNHAFISSSVKAYIIYIPYACAR